MAEEAVAHASRADMGETGLLVPGHDGDDQRVLHGRPCRDADFGNGRSTEAKDLLRDRPRVREDVRLAGEEPSLPTEVGEPLVRARLQADHTQGGMRIGELDRASPPFYENSKRQIRELNSSLWTRYVL